MPVYILDNEETFEDHTIYFIDVPKALVTPTPNKIALESLLVDYGQERCAIIGVAPSVDWRHNRGHETAHVLSVAGFVRAGRLAGRLGTLLPAVQNMPLGFLRELLSLFKQRLATTPGAVHDFQALENFIKKKDRRY